MKIKEEVDSSQISIYIALIPLISLLMLLAINIYHYGADSSAGPNQVALIFAAAIASLLSVLKYKTSWDTLQQQIVNNIKVALVACIILLLVGALTGAWLIGGIVPTMIYYGLYIFSDTFFLVTACIIASITSLIVGSSWSTSATIGVALMGIGLTFNINPGLIAGAIISGAYFGDKLSPLSDTTNLASGVVGVEVVEHIKYMSITTIPSYLITLVVFTILGFQSSNNQVTEIAVLQATIAENYNTSIILLFVPVVVIYIINKKVSAIPALFLGVVLGCICALTLQQSLLDRIMLDLDLQNYYQLINYSIYSSIAITTTNDIANGLFKSSGMQGMLTTIWLIICAMIFGGAMDGSKFLQRITSAIIGKAKRLKDLITLSIASSFLTNVSASDQYLSVVLPGKMFLKSFKDRNYNTKNLSRSIEDGGSVTSVLIPWNTCAVFHASVLGVATVDYMFWTIFCIVTPFVSIVIAHTNYKIQQ